MVYMMRMARWRYESCSCFAGLMGSVADCAACYV